MQYHAFLSYSHTDAAMMRRIRTDLVDAGLSIWTDESLVPGTLSWKNAIEEAIQSTMTLVVLLSPDAKHSDWIEREIEYAQACGVKILPILIRGADEISAVPFELINVQRIDLREDYSIGIERLITTINGEVEGKTFSPVLPHTAPSPTHGRSSLEKLNPLSFYDHVKLFIWIFWQPQKLTAYLNRYDEDSVAHTASWLASNFMWIAYLAPAIGIILGTVTIPSDAPAINITGMQALSAVIFLGGWFMTGTLGWREDRAFAVLLLVGTCLIIFALFSGVETFSGVVVSNGGGFTRPVFLMTIGILLSTAAGIAFQMAPAATGSIAGLLLGSLLFNSLFEVQLGIDGGITAFVIFANAILVAWVVDNSLRTGTRTAWHVLSFGIIIVAGIAAIVTYFLGGWIFLQQL